VIGDLGAVHCRSSKQTIVTKSSTEVELVGLSDSANQGLFLRNFLRLQGYSMPAVTVYQDNLSCMALIARGRSGGAKSTHRHALFLDERPGGQRRGRDSAQGDL
jgi:hypothetical protein